MYRFATTEWQNRPYRCYYTYNTFIFLPRFLIAQQLCCLVRVSLFTENLLDTHWLWQMATIPLLRPGTMRFFEYARTSSILYVYEIVFVHRSHRWLVLVNVCWTRLHENDNVHILPLCTGIGVLFREKYDSTAVHSTTTLNVICFSIIFVVPRKRVSHRKRTTVCIQPSKRHTHTYAKSQQKKIALLLLSECVVNKFCSESVPFEIKTQTTNFSRLRIRMQNRVEKCAQLKTPIFG